MRIFFRAGMLSAGIIATSVAYSATIPNYPCYRTVETTYASAERLVETHPHLAEWIDIGDSWEKTAGEGGHDLMVLKLTNKNKPGPKPAMFVTSAIHAREFATAELTTRFAEHLVAGYNNDPDITWMLDYQEVHFLLITNPDGRKKAEPNVMWRKNTNRSFCGRTSSNRGVDLNRNFDYFWGSAGSGEQCSETYRGPGAASEPEVQAIQNYIRSIMVDRRGPGRNDRAPLDTTGVYLDIHSYGEIIYQATGSPNNREITTMNRKLAFFNGYRPVLSEELSFAEPAPDADGEAYESHKFNHTYDFAYGDLGVASYLIELGTSFFQSCSYFQDNIVPGNFKALLFALRVARLPYMLSAGPEITDAKVSNISGNRTLTARADDTRYGTRSGSEAAQNISGAYFTVNTPPWADGVVKHPMQAKDGQYNATKEDLTATVSPNLLIPGRNIIFIQSVDADGNAGPVASAFIDVAE